MKKSVHTYLDDEIIEKVKELSKKNKTTINSEYEKILKIGLSYINTEDKYDNLLKQINKNAASLYYIKKLLIQTYSDLRLEQIPPKKSENLIKFNKRLYGNKHFIDD